MAKGDIIFTIIVPSDAKYSVIISLADGVSYTITPGNILHVKDNRDDCSRAPNPEIIRTEYIYTPIINANPLAEWKF